MTTSQSSPVQIDPHEPPLSAPLKLAFDYTRSVGPLLGQFFTALRERRIVGVRGSDGKVLVPPAEYDPVTWQQLTEIVPVASVGTVVSWTWQPEPLEGQPLDRPFAWALITLDGADTPLLHAVDAGSADAISTGARVRAHWVEEPVGSITDIAYFVPGDQPEDVPPAPEGLDPVTMIVVPTSIEIQHTASLPESTFLRALEQGKLLGARTGDDGKVYFPPKEANPATGLELDNYVELPDKGTVTTFAIINIPFAGQRIKPPTSRPTSCSTAPTFPSCTWSPRSIRPRCGWECGFRRCGNPRRSGVLASTTSTTSGRQANPTPTTTPISITSEE